MSKKMGAPRGGVRLLPTMMVTLAAIAGLKAVAVAQGASENANAQTSAAPPPQTAANTSAASAPGGAPASGDQCIAQSFADQAGLSQSEVQVLQALGARRQVLDQRSAEIETRADLLAAAERRMSDRLGELRQLETQVGRLLGQLDATQEQRMNGLVDVYQRMRAKDAAAVFNQLDETTLMEVAGRMRQQNLAEVMGKMTPDRARRLTQMLAERARPPGISQSMAPPAPVAAITPPASAAPAAGGR